MENNKIQSKENKKYKIAFTGGGTLGHVMPNIYLINDLKKTNNIIYIGGKGIEQDYVNKQTIKYYSIDATKLYRGKFVRNLTIPFKLIKSIHQAKKILKQEKPDLVVSKGGFVSLPVCLAARKLRIPIISHESDYSFGLANKLILRVSNYMCVNFEHLTSCGKNIVFTGPIISNDFKLSNINSNIKLNIDASKPTILFIGGSSGSKIINENVKQALPLLLEKYNIIHITGKGNTTKDVYANYNQIEITNNMPYLYSVADLVVGRAGAGIVFECAYMQKPMLLIPLYNGASRGDQMQNAEYFYKKGCAKILEEQKLTKNSLVYTIDLTMNSLDNMKSNLKKLDLSNGKEKMLDLISKTLKSTNKEISSK